MRVSTVEPVDAHRNGDRPLSIWILHSRKGAELTVAIALCACPLTCHLCTAWRGRARWCSINATALPASDVEYTRTHDSCGQYMRRPEWYDGG